MRSAAICAPLLCLLPFLPVAESSRIQTVYEKDVAYLLDELESKAGVLLRSKHIDWQSVRKDFTAAARDIADDVAHVKLCARLVARLEDGHATLTKIEVEMPAEPPQYGVGLCFAEAQGKLLVKQSFGPAQASAVQAGMELLSVEGVKAADWLAASVRELRDTRGFSTEHAARYAACHWSLAGTAGRSFALEFDTGRGKKKLTLTCDKSGGSPRYVGPVFLPKDLKPLGKRDAYGTLASGFAYILLGECSGDLPTELDTALAEIGGAKGLILDMRANNGGGTDHEAVFGRFLATGEKFRQYKGVGAASFTGPMVVIVDGGTRSTGETVAGMFKEDGRAYMIGASNTAGMSATKDDITVPSRLFAVHFAVGSNKQRFNDGAGIEGLGVVPHEIVAWDRKLLADDVDPFVKRAEELLGKGFPKGAVQYAPPKARKR